MDPDASRARLSRGRVQVAVLVAVILGSGIVVSRLPNGSVPTAQGPSLLPGSPAPVGRTAQPSAATVLGPGGSRPPAVGPVSPGPTAPRPTGGLEPELGARIQFAGLIERGGMWAVRDNRLLTSPDGGTWTGVDLPAEQRADTLVLLDPVHVWAVAHPAGPATDLPPGTVVSRSADGGMTWVDADVTEYVRSPSACPFGYSASPEDVPLFVDPDHGFLAHKAPCGPDATTILGTSDGGATWSLAGVLLAEEPDYVVSDAQTLWVTSSGDHPILRVSRDGGLTWAPSELPGLKSQLGSQRQQVAAIRFFTPSAGMAVVRIAAPDETFSFRFYGTADGGRTWMSAADQLDVASLAPPALGDQDHWMTLVRPGKLRVTANAGASWRTFGTGGLPFLQWNLQFTDALHGYTVPDWEIEPFYGHILYVTRDGGATWAPAPFGEAVPPPSSDPDTDWLRALGFASTLGHALPDGDIGWRLLADFSKAQFGSEAAFRAAEESYLRTRQSTSGGRDDVVPLDGRSGPALGAIWEDLAATADTSRAYRVVLSHDGSSRERFVVAPLLDGGGLRIWIVSQT